jgi:hypothetical protein
LNDREVSKPLGNCDQSGAEFAKRALKGEVVGGINIDCISRTTKHLLVFY